MKAENQDKADPVETSKSSTKVNLTAPAQLFISSALETRQLFGSSHLIDVLRGSKNKKVLRFKHDQLQCHGAGRAHTDSEWQQLVNEFIRQGLLERDEDHGSIKVTPKGIAVRQGEEVWGELPGRKHRVKSQQEPQHNLELFEQLRALRTRLAEEKGVPPYVIFHDRSLIEMATYYPRTPGEFSRIYGVGRPQGDCIRTTLSDQSSRLSAKSIMFKLALFLGTAPEMVILSPSANAQNISGCVTSQAIRSMR